MHTQELGSVALSLEEARRGKAGRLADPAVFQELLALLAAYDLQPEKFDLYDDPDSRKRGVAFDGARFMELLTAADAHALPVFYRSAAPAYEFYAGHMLRPRLSPSAVFAGGGRKGLADLFRLMDDLCVLFQPVYGGMAFDWPGDSEQVNAFNRMLRTRTVHKYGFETVAVRNYVGPEIKDRFDFKQLQDLGADVVELSWNAVRFDLTPNPWAAPFEVLHSQMQHLNTSLAAQGLLGDYSRSLLKKAGPGWPAVLLP